MSAKSPEEKEIICKAIAAALSCICDHWPEGMYATPRIKAIARRVRDTERKYIAGEANLNAFLGVLDAWQAIVIAEAIVHTQGRPSPEGVTEEKIAEAIVKLREPPPVQEKLF